MSIFTLAILYLTTSNLPWAWAAATAHKRSREELPPSRGQGQWLGGATPRPRPWVVAERSYPMSKEWWLRGSRRAERSYSTFKVRRGGSEEISLSKVRSSSCALLDQP